MAFQVHIYQPMHLSGMAITFIDDRGPANLYIARPVELVFEKVDDLLVDIPPTLIIPRYYCENFLEVLQNELTRHGVKSQQDMTIEGTLKAQKYHLEDLRKLLELE